MIKHLKKWVECTLADKVSLQIKESLLEQGFTNIKVEREERDLVIIWNYGYTVSALLDGTMPVTFLKTSDKIRLFPCIKNNDDLTTCSLYVNRQKVGLKEDVLIGELKNKVNDVLSGEFNYV